MSNDIISVIVPVYNVEQYLQECLDSILLQTYQNIEIILINDGSSDNSGKICDEYAFRDARIKVIHKKNEGVSVARNVGLDSCNGEYICFIDGDDLIEPIYIEDLYINAIKYKADIVTSDYKGYNCKKECYPSYYKRKGRYISNNITGHEALSLMLRMRENCSVWSKIFKRSSIGNLRFPIGKINEDALFLFYLYLKVEKVSSIPQANYYYRINPNGLARTINEHQFDIVENMEEMDEFFTKHNISSNCQKALKIWKTHYCTNLLFILHNSNLYKSHFSKIDKMRQIIRTNFWNVIFSNDLTYKNKFKTMMVYLGY